MSQHVSGIILTIFRRTKALLLHLVCWSNEGADGVTTGWLVGTDWKEAILRLSHYLYFGTENTHEMSVRTVGPGCEI